ncbi:YopX family protein [Bacillus velezensis]|uniref:YopX family protein n=1 Tax=Bacillus velezensis TaxID=492670 RepID=UPI0021B12787|nr:YopX family protein [Bacillus velezensis]MCT6684533.1 YopX family protein [Bacillus velezensis]
MNTAYRVWDGEQMHYWDDERISLGIIGDQWALWRKDSYGFQHFITGSHEKGSVLMWGTEIRETVDESKPGETVYAGHIVSQTNLDPDLQGMTNLIGEVKMIEGSWCIVNEKEKECRPLFSEAATNKVIGDVYQNPELLEGAE